MDDSPKGKLLRDYTPAASSPSGFNVPKAASSDQSGVRDRRHPSVGEIRGSGNAMRPLGVGGDPGVSGGAFYTMRTVVSGGADNGDIYLVGGTAGGIIVAEYLIYDASGASWAGTPGQHLQLKMTGTGQETSGILDPVFTVSTAVISVVTTLGTDTFPASGDLSGKFSHVSLGSFYSGGFTPADVGNVPCTFCWGGYNTTR